MNVGGRLQRAPPDSVVASPVTCDASALRQKASQTYAVSMDGDCTTPACAVEGHTTK